jgi:hypothetical protein
VQGQCAGFTSEDFGGRDAVRLQMKDDLTLKDRKISELLVKMTGEQENCTLKAFLAVIDCCPSEAVDRHSRADCNRKHKRYSREQQPSE